MFIWSETYNVVVYIPADATPTNYISLNIWLIPGAEDTL